MHLNAPRHSDTIDTQPPAPPRQSVSRGERLGEPAKARVGLSWPYAPGRSRRLVATILASLLATLLASLAILLALIAPYHVATGSGAANTLPLSCVLRPHTDSRRSLGRSSWVCNDLCTVDGNLLHTYEIATSGILRYNSSRVGWVWVSGGEGLELG